LGNDIVQVKLLKGKTKSCGVDGNVYNQKPKTA
jgi:hypothetical protein